MVDAKPSKIRIIQSVQRSLDIIECFENQYTELTLNEMSTRLKLNKSTVHGLLNTLVVNHYISQNNHNGKYRLGRRFISKGLLASESIYLDFKEIGSRYLRILSEKYKVSSHLFCYKNGLLTFMEMSVPSTSYYVVSSVIGRTMPLHATASGKIVLSEMDPVELEYWFESNELSVFTEKTVVEAEVLRAELNEIRVSGVSLEDEVLEMGLFSIALPIVKGDGNLFGTISITGQALKVRALQSEIVKDMRQFKALIEKELFSDK